MTSWRPCMRLAVSDWQRHRLGVLKRIVVIDVGDGPFVLDQSQITKTEGSQTGDEGCLSVPGKAGTVTRPNEVTVRFTGEDGNTYDLEGTELLARAICHECESSGWKAVCGSGGRRTSRYVMDERNKRI